MTTWYVQQGAPGANSGTLSNPWNAWSSVVWTSLAAGDELKVIGILTPNDFSGIGAHNGVLGNEVVISGYDSSSRIAPISGGSIRLNRSHTKLIDINFTGEIIFQSSDTTVDTTGTNIHVDGVDLTGKGVKIDYPSGTGASNVNRKYKDLYIRNMNIEAAQRGVFVLAGAASATAIMQIDGLVVENVTCNNIQDSFIELRMESTASTSSYFNNLVFRDLTINNVGNGASGGCALRLHASVGTTPMSDGLIMDNITCDGIGYEGNTGVGGVYIHGFGLNAKQYGQNKIINLSVSNSIGAAGALNILRSNFVEIYGLRADTISTGTIDGNGLLIDMYNSNIKAKNIILNNINGKDGVNNSGCALMILQNTRNIEVSELTVDNCRHGIFFDNGYTENILIRDSEFNNCSVDGIYGNLANNKFNKIWNNKFSGLSGSRAINSTQPAKLIHDYNTFNNFDQSNINYTYSENEKVGTDGTNKISGYA